MIYVRYFCGYIIYYGVCLVVLTYSLLVWSCTACPGRIFAKGCKGCVGVHVICLYSNLYNTYTYKASECKCAIIRLHCATSKSSLWNMEYVARGGAFECPRIYRTSVHVYIYTCTLYVYIHALVPAARSEHRLHHHGIGMACMKYVM